MQGLIIVNGYFVSKEDQKKVNRLKDEFASFGVYCEIRSSLDLLPFTNGNETHIQNIEDFSFAIDFSNDLYLADAINERMPLFNSSYSLHLTKDRMTTLLALKDSNIKTAISIPAPFCNIENPGKDDVNHYLDQVERRLGYPLIFKRSDGSLVLIVNNRAELNHIYIENLYIPHFYQRYVSESNGRDYQIVVIGNRVIATVERISKVDPNGNNVSGRKAFDASKYIPDIFKQSALKIADILDLDYVRVDLATNKIGEPIFLGLDSNPDVTDIERLTDTNIIRELVFYILKSVKK